MAGRSRAEPGGVMAGDPEKPSETPWAELNRSERSLAIKRLGKLSHREIGKRLGVSAQSIQVHASKYGAQDGPRRASVQNGQRESVAPYRAKTATTAKIRKALLRETRPDGTPYSLADVLLVFGPNPVLSPARRVHFNWFQNEFLKLLEAGRLP